MKRPWSAFGAWRACRSRSRAALDLHRRLSRRDGRGLRLSSRLAGGGRIDRAGAFKYEPVAGAPAEDAWARAVPDDVKESRWKRFMEKPAGDQRRLLKRKIGKRLSGHRRRAGRRTDRARSPRAAPRPMRRGSTAPFTFRSRSPLRAGDIVTGRSNAPTPMTCWRGDLGHGPNIGLIMPGMGGNWRIAMRAHRPMNRAAKPFRRSRNPARRQIQGSAP